MVYTSCSLVARGNRHGSTVNFVVLLSTHLNATDPRFSQAKSISGLSTTFFFTQLKDSFCLSNQSLASFHSVTQTFLTAYQSYFQSIFFTPPATYGYSLFAKSADGAFKHNSFHMLVIHFPLPAFASFVLELEFNFEIVSVTGSDSGEEERGERDLQAEGEWMERDVPGEPHVGSKTGRLENHLKEYQIPTDLFLEGAGRGSPETELRFHIWAA